jgi:hypothetical protein
MELYKSDGRVRPSPPPIELEGALKYEVEAIERHRTSGRKRPKTSYLVAWKSSGPEHISWEPEANVANASEKIAEY